MVEFKEIREIIERVVGATLAAHVAAIQEEVVAKATEEIEKSLPAAAAASEGPATPPGEAPTDLLNAAVSSVLDCVSQTDILTSLLEGSSKFAERVALFVIRAGNATGWRATGLEASEDIKGLPIDLNKGLAARAYHDRVAASAAAAEFDARFISACGAPADGTNVVVLPLVLRDKVAALFYADAGESGGKLDPSALECLVRCAGLWLEIVAARKVTPATAPAPEAPSTEKIERYTEPAASHAEEAAPTAPPPPAPPPMAAPEPAFTPAAAAAAPAFAPEPAPTAVVAAAAPAASAVSPQDEEVHKKAKRFAKLLVDEIKLYNQSKVVEGRANKDLYARLKDDIDKSRATFDRRYGTTSAASANYFTQELVRILANNDPSLLGSGFPE